MHRFMRLASLCAFALIAVPAGAATLSDRVPRGEVMPAAVHPVAIGGARQALLDASPAWQSFRSQHGDWIANWNGRTASPHRAFGPSIPLPGAANDSNSVDRAVRAFVRGNPDLFGAPELAAVNVGQHGHVWYARYRQTLNGVPVLFSDWEFRVGTNGRLMMFGADRHSPATAVRTTPALVRAAAREAAHTGLDFVDGRDKVEDGGTWILPWNDGSEGAAEYRLVYEEHVLVQDPPGNWWTLVDANTGEVLWRQDRVRHNISGKVTATIHPITPTDLLETVNLPNLKVFVGPNIAVTDSVGNYSAAATGVVIVTDSLVGTYCDINDDLPPPGVISTSASNFQNNVNLLWDGTKANDAERDAYYHVNRVHAFIKGVDPTFTGMDYAVPTRVNVNSTCNAFWDGVGVNFFRAGAGCVNTGTIADVIYHEYGHGINDNMYVAAGSPNGMLNAALHEGMADVNAAFLQDDPNIGKGFFGPGTTLRHLVNTARWPDNESGDPHATGLIIGGAFWDLRQSIGITLATHLEHFAKYGKPDDPDDGVAFSDYFVETLVVDDNDANLGNGTPHFSQIVAAFNAHGIGTGFFIHITHTPLADQNGTSPYPVVATFQYSGPVGTLDPNSPTLHYSINNGGYTTLTMTPTGNPNEFRAQIPFLQFGIVHYWISAKDTYGAGTTDPAVAPTRAVYTFLAGPASTVFLQDMDADPHWTVGAPGDNAVTGTWERGNPNGTNVGGVQCAPEDDHTPAPGIFCWVTGIGTVGDDAGANDVDGGRTTLTTNTFDATAGQHPMLEYYRWYTNALGGEPNADYWRTYISNNGGASWVVVENTLESASSWQRILFFIDDYVTPTANMKMRFVAQDSAGGSLVEAGIDDFRLLHFPATLAVGDGNAAAGLEFSAPMPNPAFGRTTLRFTLPAPGRVALRVYDLSGRSVRTLADGALEAGLHAIQWNGLDDGGHRVAAGPYFVRLSNGARELARKITIVR